MPSVRSAPEAHRCSVSAPSGAPCADRSRPSPVQSGRPSRRVLPLSPPTGGFGWYRTRTHGSPAGAPSGRRMRLGTVRVYGLGEANGRSSATTPALMPRDAPRGRKNAAHDAAFCRRRCSAAWLRRYAYFNHMNCALKSSLRPKGATAPLPRDTQSALVDVQARPPSALRQDRRQCVAAAD
jgi:hypothetical protein